MKEGRFPIVEWSVFSDDFSLYPYPYLEPLYPQKEVLGFQSEGMKFLFRYEDCKAFLFHSNLNQDRLMDELEFNQLETEETHPTSSWYRQYCITNPDNIHIKATVRKLLLHMQSGENKLRWFDACESIIDPALRAFSEEGQSIEFMHHFGGIPFRIITTILGITVDESEEEQLRQAGRTFIAGWGRNDKESLMATEKALLTLRERTSHLVQGRCPLISDFSKRHLLTDDHVHAILMFFLISSTDNIAISSAFMLINFLKYPDQRRELEENPALMSSAFMEFLRLDEHIKSVPRYVHEPFTYKDYHFERGDIINLFYPGANRDPQQWASPSQLDFSRNFDDGHIIFGGGRHACVGREIAVTIMRYTLHCFVKYIGNTAAIEQKRTEINGRGLGERALAKLYVQT